MTRWARFVPRRVWKLLPNKNLQHYNFMGLLFLKQLMCRAKMLRFDRDWYWDWDRYRDPGFQVQVKVPWSLLRSWTARDRRRSSAERVVSLLMENSRALAVCLLHVLLHSILRSNLLQRSGQMIGHRSILIESNGHDMRRLTRCKRL